MTTTRRRRDIFVVGGARGIGQATVDALLARGDRVFVTDRDAAELERRRSAWNGASRLFPMDLTKRDDIRHAFEWVRAETGVPAPEPMIDAVVITAALHHACPVEHLSDDAIDRVLDVNLVSHIRFVRDVIPLLRSGGRVVAVSSLSAQIGIPMQALYSASKAGLEIFYESLSLELASRDIRCVVVQPGNVNTGFNETGQDYHPTGHAHLDDMYRKVVTRIDSRHGISPETVARAIEKALDATSGRLCYTVGPNAMKASWAKRLLGRDLAHRMMQKAMDL